MQEMEQTQAMLAKMTESQKRAIISQLESLGRVNCQFLTQTRGIPQITAKMIEKKWRKEKRKNVPIEVKKRQLQQDRKELSLTIHNDTSNSPTKHATLRLMIDRMLVEYDELLTSLDYANIAAACIQTKQYLRGIELAEKYLNLETPSINGLVERIQEIKQKENSSKVVEQYATKEER